MKKTINEYDFANEFEAMNRGDQFSWDAKIKLFEHLTEYEEETGEELELDVIAICCEYCEYASFEEFFADYDREKYQSMEDIEAKTEVIKVEEYLNDEMEEDCRFIIRGF